MRFFFKRTRLITPLGRRLRRLANQICQRSDDKKCPKKFEAGGMIVTTPKGVSLRIPDSYDAKTAEKQTPLLELVVASTVNRLFHH